MASLTGPGVEHPLSHASEANFSADASRLIADIPRTLRRLGWGRMRTEFGPSADDQREIVRALGLVPSGQTALIIGRGDQHGRVHVNICVGHFGNPRLERVFLDELHQAMTDEPMPKRGWGFVLPE